MNKVLITETDRTNILNMYNITPTKNNSEEIVITDWLSPDEKYIIFLDELYDIQNKSKLGNIWEDFNNLKTFLSHSFEVSSLPKELKEEANLILSNKLLTEGSTNLTSLKSDFKLLLNEGLWSSFKNWAYETGKSTIDGFKEFVKTSAKGLSDVVDKISKGEWKEVFSLLGKGVLYLARKLRSALYHPIGLILDAILVATGIGKAVQWIPWAIIVALDVYEMISGDYEENLPTWQRLLFLGVDILGLVFAGAAAKSGRLAIEGVVSGIRTTEQLGTVAAKNPTIKNLLTKMLGAVEKVPSLLERAVNWLKTKFPMGAKFIGGILGGIGKFLKGITDFVSKALHFAAPGTTKLAKGTRAAVGTTALVGGIGTYGHYKQEKGEEELGTSLASSNVKSTYDVKKI